MIAVGLYDQDRLVSFENDSDAEAPIVFDVVYLVGIAE